MRPDNDSAETGSFGLTAFRFTGQAIEDGAHFEVVLQGMAASRTELALLMNVITFTPGTVALEIHGSRLFIHVMDLRDEELFRRRFELLESRIIDAFGTRLERVSPGN